MRGGIEVSFAAAQIPIIGPVVQRPLWEFTSSCASFVFGMQKTAAADRATVAGTATALARSSAAAAPTGLGASRSRPGPWCSMIESEKAHVQPPPLTSASSFSMRAACC
jgi:hypothetical protein